MAKIMLYVCFVLLVCTVISAVPARRTGGSVSSASCGRHGDSCVSGNDCCGTLRCHIYAHRCQVVITQEEILAQREKILGRRGPDQ